MRLAAGSSPNFGPTARVISANRSARQDLYRGSPLGDKATWVMGSVRYPVAVLGRSSALLELQRPWRALPGLGLFGVARQPGVGQTLQGHAWLLLASGHPATRRHASRPCAGAPV